MRTAATTWAAARPTRRSAVPSESATAFLQRANAGLERLWARRERQSFVNQTYITDDTDPLAAEAEEAVREAAARLRTERLRYRGMPLDGDSARQLKLLALSASLPAWTGRSVPEPPRSHHDQVWKSRCDMPPAEFEAETERLWGQVRPLYEALHCYVRARGPGRGVPRQRLGRDPAHQDVHQGP